MRYDPRFRRAKIVATVGPASEDESTLEAMIRAGTNVLRINSSHGTAEWRAEIIERISGVRDRMQLPVGILLDLQGPRIRVGELSDPHKLVQGSEVVFAPESEAGAGDIPTTYGELAKDVSPGDRVLLDDGLLEVEAIAIDGSRVIGRVIHGGELESHKGINLPGVQVTAPAVTAKDREDIELARCRGVDLMGLSFVRVAGDVNDLRALIPPETRIVAKIEKATALDDLDGIVSATDSVMVARGDLGVELPFEEVPLAQKRVIRLANQFGRPVITATQMLESMVKKPRPTRAEASDVANAVLDGTDAVMLSAETAIGAYPVEAVRAMVRIIEETESAGFTDASPQQHRAEQIFSDTGPDTSDAIAAASCAAAEMLEVPLIVCFSHSGFTVRKVAAHRSTVPIIGFTTESSTYHQLSLTWGVRPALVESVPTYEKMLDIARDYLISRGYAKAGDRVVVTAGVPFDTPGTTNLIKVETV